MYGNLLRAVKAGFYRVAGLVSFEWVVAALTLFLLISHVYHSSWRGHIQQPDSMVFQARAVHFLEEGSWRNMGYNEYQPGALWWFVVIAKLASAPANFESYLTALVGVNLILLIGHWRYFRRYGPPGAGIVFWAVAAAMGPILFYRFELIVSALVIAALHFAFRGKWGLAGWWLGLGTAVKLYPVVLLPLVLIFAYRERIKWGKVIACLLLFTLGIAIPYLSFYMTGGTWEGIKRCHVVHGLKPVGPDGLWGSMITLASLYRNEPVNVAREYGVFGILPKRESLSATLMNWFWVFPVGLAYGFILRNKKYLGFLGWEWSWFILLLFVVFTKVLNPQYLWWFAVFTPMIYEKNDAKYITLMVSVVSLGLTQIIYPINFTAFTDWFYGNSSNNMLFCLNLLRNVLLLLLIVLGILVMRSKEKPERTIL